MQHRIIILYIDDAINKLRLSLARRETIECNSSTINFLQENFMRNIKLYNLPRLNIIIASTRTLHVLVTCGMFVEKQSIKMSLDSRRMEGSRVRVKVQIFIIRKMGKY